MKPHDAVRKPTATATDKTAAARAEAKANSEIRSSLVREMEMGLSENVGLIFPMK